MKIKNLQSQKRDSSELTTITQYKQVVNQKEDSKFFSPNNGLFLSQKKRNSQKQNINLLNMSSQQLKKSVQNDPFMRAKLKCLIKSSEKSLGKINQVKSPKMNKKSNFCDCTNLQTMYIIKKQQKVEQKQRMSELMKAMRDDDRQVDVGQKTVK